MSVASQILGFLTLCAMSAGVYAESCNPAAPRLDSGAGFTPFGENAQALARAGHSGPAWEWALGANIESSQKVQGSLDWVSGKVYRWRLVNDGAGKEVLTIRDGGKVVLKLTYPSRMDAGNALELRVSTNPSVGPETSIAARLTKLNGHAVSGALSQPGTRENSAQALYYYFPEMAKGFIAKGTVSLTYRRKPPSGSRVQFAVRAGTIPCNASGNPPAVSISAPAANSIFSAPATITVSANAEDTDGTVMQVAFYANGSLLGTATASPFAVQWANMNPGIYNLIAVATDNDDLQTTSTTVPITVNAAQALYFIHVDHLNAPRLVADALQATVWSWNQQEPFGENLANQNAEANSSSFTYSPRLAGQYYDGETSLHYNYLRNYDASLGRYTRSDPSGLAGGLNTYSYVDQTPLTLFDEFALWSTEAHNKILEIAFANLSPDLLQAIKNGSRYADLLQLQRWSYIHAMRSSPEESEATCLTRLCDWYQKHYENYDRYRDSPNSFLRRFAFWSLGMALHPTMDSTSPMHENCSIAWDFADAAFHNEDPSLEGLSALTPELLRKTVELTRRASRREYCRTCN